MNNIEQQKIEEYLLKLQTIKEDEFIDETKRLKNQVSDKIANIICDEVSRVYNTNSLNPEKVSEIISFSLEAIANNYKKEITSDFKEKPQDDIKRERETKNENTLIEVSNKIITDVNTHIKFRESLEMLNYNRGYHNIYNKNQIKKIEDLEVFIRHIIKTNTTDFKERLEQIYAEILDEYNKKEEDFLNNIATYKKEEQLVSSNEAAFIDTPVRTLDPNGIFDDNEEYESENAKRFL